MKRSALASVVATVGLLALSAVPASAAPIQKFGIPEECITIRGDVICASERAQFSIQSTPSGVETAVGQSEFHFSVVSNGEVVVQSDSVDKEVSVSRNDEPVVFHMTSIQTDAVSGSTCTVTSNYTQTGEEIRHNDTELVCTES